MFKKSYQIIFFFLMVCSLGISVFANVNTSQDRVWQEVDDTGLKRSSQARMVEPASYKAFRLDRAALLAILARAPMEFTDAARNTELILTFPMPDGSFQRFRIFESPIVEPGLLEKFPELVTYSGQGIDDPTATVRFDFLPSGFHSQILSTKGTILVDPYFKSGDTENYVSYNKFTVTPTEDFICHFNENKDFQALLETKETRAFNIDAPDVTSGGTLRTYRLALAATFEYGAAVGSNTVAGTLAAQTLIMNRVNGVYERDLSLRMVVVANNNLIVYAQNNTAACGGVNCTSTNDPYTNSNGSTMLGQNQTTLDTIIGSANYDIGHVFSTGGGGVANLGVPCSGNKAGGVTGLPNPVGDPFAIDFVAHEMGHQWSGNHTYNGLSGNCNGQRSNTSSFEPGSGITIMAYAGICGNQDLAGNSIDTMHVKSLEVMVNYSQVNPTGNSCDVETATGNNPPTVTLTTPGPYNIPKQTPFYLTASATDLNGDSLTYDWQQYNFGGSGGGTTAVPNTDADGTARPIFRNYLPTTDGTRYFPSLQYIRNNANVPPSTTGGFLTGELMSAITRTLTFQVVVRDNRAGGGGINTATANVMVDGNSGPFNVTAPNTGVTWNGSSSQTVTWNVANTTNAPVSAANVKISFSADGGLTFPTTVLASTANDGTETITVPNVATTQGRIKVEGVSNIFFDMSDTNFTVTAVASSIRAPFDYDGDDKTDLSIFRPSVGQWWYQKSSDNSVFAGTFGTSTDRITPADFTGDQKADFAFFRPSTGEWFVLRSEDFSFYAVPFGTSGDTPVPADYDGDGKADTAVYRSSTNTWYIQKSNGSGTDIIGFGTSGDVPTAGDYDGDSKADIAIYRPSLGQWWIRKSSDSSVFAATFGSTADKPVQGFYTADNKTDMAFWRPLTGEWFVLRSEDFSFYANAFGISTDIPVPGDYDGDDRFDAAVFRSSSNTWFVQQTTAGTLIQAFGNTGDLPTPNAYIP